MNVSRSIGLLVIVLLSACDAQQTPAPKAKQAAEVAAPAAVAAPEAAPAATPPAEPAPVAVAPVVEAEVEKAVTAKVAPTEPEKAPMHELKPNVPVVPVVAAKAGSGKELQVKADPLKPPVVRDKSQPSTATLKREPVSNKSKPAREVVKDTHLSQPKLDLSLPPELVQQLTPPKNVITAPHKPILPPMFSTKDAADKEAFQLNGRLLSNEMQLQMRNNDRHEIEGAALDFKFKQ